MRFLFLILSLLLSRLLYAQEPTTILRSGDLLFQNIDCGEMCDAIEAVTEGYHGQKFSHMGLVILRNDSVFVIESIGAAVQLTPYSIFKNRSAHPLFIGRLKSRYRHLIPQALSFCLSQMGVPYDDDFLYNNEKYYCSELIYDAFKNANNDKPVFALEPMTFKQPGTDVFFPVWQDYYQKLKMPIPQDSLGCNPGGLSRSKKIKILKEKL